MKLKQAVVAAVAALAIGTALPVFAADEAGHDHKAGEAGHGDEAHFAKKSFGSAKEAWGFVSEKTAEAEQLVASNKLEPVHEIGEQLGSAIHALEEKSDMVAAENKSKLASVLKQMDKAADDLHHAAEKGDAAASSLSVKKVKGLLPVLQGLYPSGSL